MAGGERRRSQLRTGIFFKCSFFGKASGSLTPKGVEERLDETFFFRESEARCSHSAASAKWEHPQLGAPGLPLLAGFPVSMVCVPLSGSSLAPPQPQAGPGFPVWGCWVTGAGEGLSIPREPSVRHGGMGLAGIPAGMLPLLGWPRRAQLLTQGSCHCHQQPPKAGAGHRAVLWGLFSVAFPPLSALFITIIKLRLFDPHESFCQRCLRVFVQSH